MRRALALLLGFAFGVLLGLMVRWLYLGEDPTTTWAWLTSIFG